MMPIFDFFEDKINKEIVSENVLDEYKSQILSLNIIDRIKELSQQIKVDSENEKGLIRTHIAPFRTNILDFLNDKYKKEKDGSGRTKKWKKILWAYYNLSRIVTEYVKIKDYNRSDSKKKILILCICTVNITDDNILANDEVANLLEMASLCNDTLVIPIYGCSFDVFKTNICKYLPQYIHLAGHGSQNKIMFSDAPVTYKKFKTHIQDCIHDDFELLFLNCCNTYCYIERKGVPFSVYSICYDNELSSKQAKDVSDVFYQGIINGSSVEDAWKQTNHSTNTNGYYVLNRETH